MKNILRCGFSIILFLTYFGVGSLGANEINMLVFVDPFFGGEEKGPILAQKHAAKTITLSAAQTLKSILQLRNVQVDLSREGDNFLTLEERLSNGVLKQADIYVAIGLSKAKRNCIRIYYPSEENTVPDEKRNDLRGTIEKLMKEGIVKESKKLAGVIYRNFEKNMARRCIEARSEKSFLLDNAQIPTVIVDFGVVNSSSVSLYIFDSEEMNKILSSLARGIIEYVFSLKDPIHLKSNR